MAGLLMKGQLNLALRSHLRQQGHGFLKIQRMMRGFNDDTIASAVATANASKPGLMAQFEQISEAEDEAHSEDGRVGAIGDGTIINNIVAAIKKFLESDFGKALLAALEAALRAWLGF